MAFRKQEVKGGEEEEKSERNDEGTEESAWPVIPYVYFIIKVQQHHIYAAITPTDSPLQAINWILDDDLMIFLMPSFLLFRVTKYILL